VPKPGTTTCTPLPVALNSSAVSLSTRAANRDCRAGVEVGQRAVELDVTPDAHHLAGRVEEQRLLDGDAELGGDRGSVAVANDLGLAGWAGEDVGLRRYGGGRRGERERRDRRGDQGSFLHVDSSPRRSPHR